jgi:N-dimethylarginine dimethylaminohydrolase
MEIQQAKELSMRLVKRQQAEASREPVLNHQLNPTKLDKPAFLLNMPFSYSADTPNNVWMEELKPEERVINTKKAVRQFLELYHFLSAESLICILPTPANCDLQDLVFTANIGIVLQHLSDKNTVIVSNFSSEPRVNETNVGLGFFKSMGYNACVCPFKFEGEAELKHLYDNIYVGGYGTRSEEKAYKWMEENFDMRVIKLKQVDPYLYHLDCTVFPINRDNSLVCTEMYTKREIAQIEKNTNIIDVSADNCYTGICNSVRLNNTILNASHIHEMKPGTELYDGEIAKNRRLEDIAVRLGFEVSYFNLSEYQKGGALLSCMVMHLNRKSYDFTLI